VRRRVLTPQQIVQLASARLSPAQLSALVEGLDWKRVGAARDTPAPKLKSLRVRSRNAS
jgi:hypothetical protein